MHFSTENISIRHPAEKNKSAEKQKCYLETMSMIPLCCSNMLSPQKKTEDMTMWDEHIYQAMTIKFNSM